MHEIECPWCAEKVTVTQDICPLCMHEVILDHEGNIIFDDETDS